MRQSVFASLLAALAGSAHAAADTPVDFAMQVQHYENEYDYDGGTVTTRVDRLGFRALMDTATPVDVGVLLGYARLSQDDRAVTAGMELTGAYGGITARAPLLRHRRLGLGLGGSYVWHTLSGRNDDQTVDMDWREATLSLDATVPVTGPLSLTGGVVASTIDGEERATGPVDHTLDFSRRRSTGTYVGVDLATDNRGGHAGITFHRGYSRATVIYFRRGF